MTKEWQPGKTAPKDGTKFWAYLFQVGIRPVKFMTAEEIAAKEGESPDNFIDCFCDMENETDAWDPQWWLPYDAIPTPPKP